MGRVASALPFWASLGLVPVAVTAALVGGWTVLLMPVASWGLFSLLDALTGLDAANPDPDTPERDLFWHRAITAIWFPVQAGLLVWLLWYVPRADHLGGWKRSRSFTEWASSRARSGSTTVTS